MSGAKMNRRAVATLATLGALASAAPMVHATAPAQDPGAAAADFYGRMSARDMAGVQRYVLPAGFTEISPKEPIAHALAYPAFEALFGSDLKIDLRAEDLHVQRFGDTAIVTGTRVGGVGPKDTPASDARVPFTTVWTLEAGGWHLRHVHLAAPR